MGWLLALLNFDALVRSEGTIHGLGFLRLLPTLKTIGADLLPELLHLDLIALHLQNLPGDQGHQSRHRIAGMFRLLDLVVNLLVLSGLVQGVVAQRR